MTRLGFAWGDSGGGCTGYARTEDPEDPESEYLWITGSMGEKFERDPVAPTSLDDEVTIGWYDDRKRLELAYREETGIFRDLLPLVQLRE